ncbi:MAG: FAD-binding protein [Coriobacteriaceae bacterium]|jgi:succinate dehydrogenase/fumarate reductase flavoprotein subunit|nr:FAD-binding protein [Coriobacteriaceae bacterium]
MKEETVMKIADTKEGSSLKKATDTKEGSRLRKTTGKKQENAGNAPGAASNLNRRQFLGLAGLAGASVAVAQTLGGCSAGSNAASNPAAGASTTAGINWDEEFDVVVVGTGTAVFGAFAALDAGAESVALLEKLGTFGGAAAFSGGAFWAPMNYVMKDLGLEDNRTDALGYVGLNAESQSTPEIIETYVDNAAGFIDWTVERLGFQWAVLSGAPLYGPQSWQDYTNLPGSREYGRSLTMAGTSVGETASSESYGGPFMWKQLRALVDTEDRIELMLETAANKLYVDDTGAVIGLRAESKGKALNIKAKRGVILGTGGFDHDTEWRKQFLRTPMFNTVALPGNTGDGHRMGLDVGADLGNMNNSYGCPATVAPHLIPEGEKLLDGSFFLNDFFTVFDAPLRRAKPHAIVVNRQGERFGNESAPYAQFNRAFEGWNSDTFTYRNIPAFFIGDASFYQHYLLPGTANDAQIGDIPEGTIVADTLEEIAKKCDIDYEKLMATINEFNRNAKAGIDPVFHRGEHHFDLQTGADFSGRTDLINPCLGPVETPPFYAFGYLPGMLETNGGLKVNAQAQVIARTGEVIPGLYAVGCCASSVFGPGYPGAGTTVAAGAVFSWIAAKDALSARPV